MNIVTGYTGTPHVTANEAQALNQGIFGPSNYVLDVGERFSATLVDANNITIEDGEGVLQGVQFRIAPGETENVSIDSGTTGYNRIDLICARYTKDAQTGVEDVNLVVIKGTPTSSTPSEPAYNTGNVLLSDSPVDFPLYKVTFAGLTPTLAQLFRTRMSNVFVAKGYSIVSSQYITANPFNADYTIDYDFERDSDYLIIVTQGYNTAYNPIPASVNLSLSILKNDETISKMSNDGTNTFKEMTVCAFVHILDTGQIPTFKARATIASESAVGTDVDEYVTLRILQLA